MKQPESLEESLLRPDGLDPEDGYFPGEFSWKCPGCGHVKTSPGTGYLLCPGKREDGSFCASYMECTGCVKEPDPRYWPITD